VASPSSTIPAKPDPSEVSLSGVYQITFVLTHTNISNPLKTQKATWQFTPKCRVGACDAKIKSLTGKYTRTAPYVKHRYLWTHLVKETYSCTGAGTTNIDAIFNVSIRVTKVKYVDGAWIGSALAGTEVDTGVATCGLSKPSDTWAIRGKRIPAAS
jgi:hypothetical protein